MALCTELPVRRQREVQVDVPVEPTMAATPPFSAQPQCLAVLPQAGVSRSRLGAVGIGLVDRLPRGKHCALFFRIAPAGEVGRGGDADQPGQAVPQMLGHQRVNDDGGFVWLNQGNVVDGNGRNEGAGGSSFYLFTDSMINQFAKAGENTTFGQYAYDFARLGVPGLKASVSYLKGEDGKNAVGGGHFSEWERDARVDYVIQDGTFKGLGASLRHGVYRGTGTSSLADQDQTRLIFNYTYSFM